MSRIILSSAINAFSIYYLVYLFIFFDVLSAFVWILCAFVFFFRWGPKGGLTDCSGIYTHNV